MEWLTASFVLDTILHSPKAVKDAQRTKTDAGTTRTFTVIWGSKALPGRAAAAEAWYRELLHRVGTTTHDA
jgi:hypothetical protein